MAPSRLTVTAAVLALAAVSCWADSGTPGQNAPGRTGGARDSARHTYPTNTPIDRACALPAEQLARVWRGYDRSRSEDVLLVPRKPAFFGSFTEVNHSGPWDFLQRVPLVVYGPHLTGAGVVDIQSLWRMCIRRLEC